MPRPDEAAGAPASCTLPSAHTRSKRRGRHPTLAHHATALPPLPLQRSLGLRPTRCTRRTLQKQHDLRCAGVWPQGCARNHGRHGCHERQRTRLSTLSAQQHVHCRHTHRTRGPAERAERTSSKKSHGAGVRSRAPQSFSSRKYSRSPSLRARANCCSAGAPCTARATHPRRAPGAGPAEQRCCPAGMGGAWRLRQWAGLQAGACRVTPMADACGCAANSFCLEHAAPPEQGRTA